MIPENITSTEPGDAPEFTALVDRLIVASIREYNIAQVCAIKINNWFDHKWLDYAGKGQTGKSPRKIADEDPMLESMLRTQTVVPPFKSKRVLHEHFFSTRTVDHPVFGKSLHDWEPTEGNAHNRMTHYSENGLFVWYTSNTKANQQGAIMAYRVQRKKVYTWFATVENRDGWRITKAKGVALQELEDLLASNH